jgi:type II secretory pathway component PulM
VIGAALLAVFAWLWFLLPRREHRRQGQARVP